MLQEVDQDRKNDDLKVQQQEERSKVYFTEKLFSQGFEFKDYSSTKFTLEDKGKDIIKNAREFHSSPAIIKGDAYDEYVCRLKNTL